MDELAKDDSSTDLSSNMGTLFWYIAWQSLVAHEQSLSLYHGRNAGASKYFLKLGF